MRIVLLLMWIVSALMALGTDHKIVIDRFKTKNEARAMFEQLQKDPDSFVSRHTNDEAFIIHTRKSGNRYIIAAEPFTNEQDAKALLNEIAPLHPKAFVSRGVADDIKTLLEQHHLSLVMKSVPQIASEPLPQTQSTPPIADKTIPAVHPVPAEQSVSIPWPIAAIFGILLLLIIAQERNLRLLRRQYAAVSDDKEKLQATMQAKNDFIAMMSHEIRAPINAIMGLSHLALESDLNERQSAQIQKINDSAAVLLTLINDILDHSKIEAGKVTIEHIPFDMNALLDDISSIVAHKAQEKNIELIFDFDRSVPNKLIGDPLRLLQVIVNLLNNAVKFTETGHVILRGRAQQSNRMNLRIQFEVIDTGIGMSSDQIERLFQSYSQGDETISRKYGGTGLGLAISKNLITLMGGTIQVRSVLNEGSAFAFDIKIHSDLDFEKRRYRLPTKDLMCKNVLIIDPNSDSIAVLKRGLEYFHYEVKGALDPLDAIALLHTYRFDLVFIDTRLNLSGEFKKELQGRIRADGLKLVWMGEDHKQRGGTILHKPYNQLSIFNTILSVYGYKDQTKAHQNNTKKLKENLRRFAGQTVLLAEDNEINRSIVGGLLAGTDIIIATASTGQEAVEAVEMNPEISVVLMDIQMPIMDGFEASRQIRKDPQNDLIPIIALTGNSLENDIQNISNAGMNGHIAKPIDVNTFYTTLYYAFEKSRNQTKKPIKTA